VVVVEDDEGTGVAARAAAEVVGGAVTATARGTGGPSSARGGTAEVPDPAGCGLEVGVDRATTLAASLTRMAVAGLADG
jgi:hypothetical protein